MSYQQILLAHKGERECRGMWIRMEPKRSRSKNTPGLSEAYIRVPHGRQKKKVREGWVVAHTYLNRQKFTEMITNSLAAESPCRSCFHLLACL